MIVSMTSEMSCPSFSPVFFPVSIITLPSSVSSEGRFAPSGRRQRQEMAAENHFNAE